MTGSDRRGDAALIASLLAGSTVAAAAEAAGVSESARRRLRDVAFQRELAAARRELVAATVARLAGIADEAVDTLRELLDEPTLRRSGLARRGRRFAIWLRWARPRTPLSCSSGSARSSGGSA
jgi:hypothetical protein